MDRSQFYTGLVAEHYDRLVPEDEYGSHAALRRQVERFGSPALELCCGTGRPLLEFVGLTADAERKASEYSKGMRQRLALAAALIADPELLILDEPLDGLDPAGQKTFRSRLRDLASEGKTVVVSSHDMSDIETFLAA